MGRQQPLLILLGVIIVGIAITVGFSISHQHYILSNRNALVADPGNLSPNAYQYRARPPSRAGGGGSYAGYQIPAALVSNENGTYVLVSVSTNQVYFVGTSAGGFGTVSSPCPWTDR